MGLTMDKILNKYNKCNKFSLTSSVSGLNITKEEIDNALIKIEELEKEQERKRFEKNKDLVSKYKNFDAIYNDIKQECIEFNSKENRDYYINKSFNPENMKLMKQMGKTDEEIEQNKKRFFHVSYIVSNVGKTTKYGKEFCNIYRNISMNIDREIDKKRYFNSNGKSPLDKIPNCLKKDFLYYEISYFNKVTVSSGLMIDYYFKLNDNTKEYLLQYRNDYQLDELEDLALFKGNEAEFYSCTHERFNSLNLNYKDMSNEELIDFINDEYYNKDNSFIINTINKIIDMPLHNKFTFDSLDVKDKNTMYKICEICLKIELGLVSYSSKEKEKYFTFNELGKGVNLSNTPAILCKLDDLIEKIQ